MSDYTSVVDYDNSHLNKYVRNGYEPVSVKDFKRISIDTISYLPEHRRYGAMYPNMNIFIKALFDKNDQMYFSTTLNIDTAHVANFDCGSITEAIDKINEILLTASNRCKVYDSAFSEFGL